MSVLLLFMPPASPSYAPLGLASLRSYLSAHHPDLHVRALDLNLETWYFLARGDESRERMVRFMRGWEGNFFDAPSYLREQETPARTPRLFRPASRAGCFSQGASRRMPPSKSARCR